MSSAACVSSLDASNLSTLSIKGMTQTVRCKRDGKINKDSSKPL